MKWTPVCVLKKPMQYDVHVDESDAQGGKLEQCNERGKLMQS